MRAVFKKVRGGGGLGQFTFTRELIYEAWNLELWVELPAMVHVELQSNQ